MRNILFIELLGGIGDVFMALPAIQALAHSYPEAKLTVFTFTPGGEVLEDDPLIHKVICIDRSQINQHPLLAREAVEQFLAHHTFDLIVSDSNYDGIEQLIQESGTPLVVTNLWRKPPPDERIGKRFLQILLAEGLIKPETIAAPQLHLTPTEQRHAQEALGNVRHPLWKTCLEAIAPADVLAAAATLLEARAGGEERQGEQGKSSSLASPQIESSSPTSFACPASLAASAPPAPPALHQWADARNILVMRLDNIGDVIMTSPALRAIKENLPHSRITLMASPAGTQAASLLPWVDDVLTWRVVWQDLGRLAFDPVREWELIETLRDRKFDAAIIFTSFSQTPHAAGYLCYLAGIPLRLGESKEWGGGVLSTEVKSAPDEMHQVERNLRLIESVGFQVSDRSLTIQIPESARHSTITKLIEHGLTANAPYLLLNPWASCQARTYPWERFAVAARCLAEITGWPVVVTGVEKDRDRSTPLLEALKPYAIDLIGVTSLPELAALIAGARLVLTNNTSTLHLADATQTPSVVLFSGTEYESQWKPRHSPFRVLGQPTPCSPCYAFTCPYNLECLDISPEQVVATGLELLQINTQLSLEGV
jgi:ADP-heptose:LPS heptosyltransferase